MLRGFHRGGGFIARDYPQWEAVNVAEDWAQWAREVFLREGGTRLLPEDQDKKENS